jgi:membrane fusion protein (multidrug efflux system)
VLIKNGLAAFTDITTGIRDSSRVQILNGLKAGDTVVVTGLLSIRPDAPVQVAKIINKK